MEVFPGITMDPQVRFGKPCLTGTRLDAASIVAALGAGDSPEHVQAELGISHEQVLTAIRYAAHVAAHLPPAVAKAS
jgi:uncharacterized protein (DUF433 family)